VVPGLEARGAVERALAKIEAAAGSVAEAAGRVRAELDDVSAEVLADARRAVRERRRVHLRYHVPGRDESTERDVDPMRVLGLDGRWYLEGWCHRAVGTRLFRLDRVEALRVLDVDGTPPPEARERDLSAGIFRPGPDDLVVTLLLRPGATWVRDHYPVESREELAGGAERVTLRTGDTAWLRRLVWRLGGRAVVEAPDWLATEVAEGARAALAAYGERAESARTGAVGGAPGVAGSAPGAAGTRPGTGD
jgi:proteasome accessory factor C